MAKPQRPSDDDELIFLPLGGSGEIGMNLNLFGFGPPRDRQWLVVDIGVMFADHRTPGIDLIMADPQFIAAQKERVLGLVLTHGHEDHIGAVAQLWPMLQCPIYATPFTAELVKGKLEDAGLMPDVDMRVVDLGATVTLGPFRIDLVTMTHSIPEPNALAIHTPVGTVLHTGDWKLDPDPVVGEQSDEAQLRKLGKAGVLAMICDSTNVFSPGEYGSEDDVRDSLMQVGGALRGRVAITCAASNVARLDSIGKVAKANGRRICVVGRSMHRMVAAARSVGLLDDFPAPVAEDEAAALPRRDILYLCTGSQGERRAALARIVEGSFGKMVLEEGDTVIFSSRIIPGNEVPIYELQNELADRGIRIITEKDHFVHVSGHPCRDELTRMYQWVQPRIAIPVHGESRHLLEHVELARELQIPEAIAPRNGTMIRLAPGRPSIVERIPVGRLYLDGKMLVNEDESHLRDRRKISFVGHAHVGIVIDGRGRVLADPTVTLQGVPEHAVEDGYGLQELVEDSIDDALHDMRARDIRAGRDFEDRIKQAARRPLLDHCGKRAVIDVSVITV